MANNSNVTSITNRRETARSQSFTYDELDRIKTAQTQATTGQHCWGHIFGYDVWANLTSRTGLASHTGCTGEPDVPGATAKNQAATYCYDIAGNLINQGGCGTISYTYDAQNRLETAGGFTYTYDGDGFRVKKSDGTTGTLYWHGTSGQVLKETDLAGNNGKDFVYFGGKLVARRDSSTVIHRFFSDHLGSSNVVTNKTGTTIEAESDFYPFGTERVITNTLPDQNYKFTGKERDGESGLHYFGARNYSSTMGRFTSPDIIGGRLQEPQTLNLYSYVLNNPLRYVDPLGFQDQPI